MQFVIIVGIVFSFCSQFGTLLCSRHFESDPLFKQEVRDFAEFLKHESEREPDPENRFRQTRSSGESDDNRRGTRERRLPEFESLLENVANKDPNGEETLPASGGGGTFSNPEEESRLGTDEKRQEVEEFLLMRRSPAEADNPIPEIVERFLNDRPMEYPDREPGVVKRSLQAEGRTCPTEDFAPNFRQTCENGPEYEMMFHPAFSEALKHDMEELLPEGGDGGRGRKCDFRKRLGPDRGVEDRALCPFRFNTSRNSSRLPEVLYVAECSCQVSRPINNEQFECVEVKRVVPVLWITSCSDGKKTYREGWEEIAVACAPVEERKADMRKMNYMT